MKEIALLLFTAGLLGGAGHCIGMCGPIVAAYSAGLKQGAILPHLLYNLGRITTYAFLGGLAGFAGSFVLVAGYAEPVQKWVMLTGGIIVMLLGLGLAGWFPFSFGIRSRLSVFPLVKKAMALFASGVETGAYYPMGMLMGLMPCGLVYGAMISAATLGAGASSAPEGILGGAFVMLAFGLGTAPALLIFGHAVSFIGARARRRLYNLSALAMIIAGALLAWRAARY